jgi:hypothetical protein
MLPLEDSHDRGEHQKPWDIGRSLRRWRWIGQRLLVTHRARTLPLQEHRSGTYPTVFDALVVGGEPLPRGDVVSKVWEYIRKHDLQNPENRREILADDNLEAVFGRKKVTMFEMNKYLSQHLTSPDAK